MSDILSSDAEKLMEQPEHDLSKAMGQLTVTSDNSDKTSPSLSDMPIDAVVPIIEKLDYRQQLKLRKVSKSLRELVDKQKSACKSIKIYCGPEAIDICFNGQEVMYTKHIYDYEGKNDFGIEIIVKRDKFKKTAFDDLASTLKNPKLQLKKFTTSVCVFEKDDLMEYYSEIHRVLESLNPQLSVKKVDLLVSSPSNLLSILPYLKPGVLEEISLGFDREEVDWRNDSIGMDQVALLEQWKQAEELELWNPFDRFPMEYATHFKRFNIGEPHLDEEKFIRIIDYFSKLDNFEHCSMYVMDSFDSVYELLGTPVSSNTKEEVFHHSIPDSGYYLEIKKATCSHAFRIEKKKQEIHR